VPLVKDGIIVCIAQFDNGLPVGRPKCRSLYRRTRDVTRMSQWKNSVNADFSLRSPLKNDPASPSMLTRGLYRSTIRVRALPISYVIFCAQV
jgi:hypothetical protein